jgi:hypothetical protein
MTTIKTISLFRPKVERVGHTQGDFVVDLGHGGCCIEQNIFSSGGDVCQLTALYRLSCL